MVFKYFYSTVFASPLGVSEIDLRDWTTFIRPADADREDGLVFVDAPHLDVEGST